MTNQKATWQHREMGDIKHLWNEIYFAAGTEPDVRLKEWVVSRMISRFVP